MAHTWDSYRRRRGLVVLSVAAIPVLGVVGTVVGALLDFEQADLFGAASAVVGFVIAIAATVLLGLWACPKCGLPFCCHSWFSNIFTTKCVHCNLEKYDPEYE